MDTQNELKRLEALQGESLREIIARLDILYSSPDKNDALKVVSEKMENGYNGPILIVKGKEGDLRWFAKSIEERLGGDDRGEVFMVFYLKSAEELLRDLSNRDKYI